LPEFDLFAFYRFILTVFVASYAVVRLGCLMWRWQSFGADDPRGMGLIRRYLIVQFLRTRLRRFLPDLAAIGVLLLVLLLLIGAHWR
jgi:hypothetical protein